MSRLGLQQGFCASTSVLFIHSSDYSSDFRDKLWEGLGLGVGIAMLSYLAKSKCPA